MSQKRLVFMKINTTMSRNLAQVDGELRINVCVAVIRDEYAYACSWWASATTDVLCCHSTIHYIIMLSNKTRLNCHRQMQIKAPM